MEDLPALLVLIRAVPAGGALRRLLAEHGDAATALAAGPGAWSAAGLTADHQAALLGLDARALAADRAWCDGPRRQVLGWHHDDYPPLLRRIPDPPAALFVEGDAGLLWHPQVAIVGSRQASPGGLDNAYAFAHRFGSGGWGVTSGLAAGIDTQAHLGALAAGAPTVAVVASGLDIVFPRANRGLAGRLGEAGAVISEYPPGTPPRTIQFPQRNRIIAGLALATVVVEAAERSGALITARLAAEAGREVFALPGSIHNPMARGCHRLIRQGVGLVETPEEVLAATAPLAGILADALRARMAADAPTDFGQRPPSGGDQAEKKVLRALGHEAVNLDQLAARSGLTVANLAPMLLAMELDGRVIAEHGRYVRRT